MNKIVKKYLNLLSYFFICFIIIFINIGSTITCYNQMNQFWFAIVLIVIGCISIFLYLLNKIYIERKITYKDIIIILLIIFGYISYKYAYNKPVALYGVKDRYEGFYVIISYYFIYLVSSTIDKKYHKRLLGLIAIFGVYQAILGTIQTLQINNIFGYNRSNNWSASYKFASGTFANPNFYSIYILMCLSFCYKMFLEKKKSLYLISTLFFMYGLIIGNTSSCLLSFSLIFIISILRHIGLKDIKNNIKKIIIALIAIIGLCWIFDSSINHRLLRSFKKEIINYTDIIKNKEYDKLGNSRILVWRITLNHTKEYYLHGIGIDNFSYIDDGYWICTNIGKKYECFDKAHNEYLQKFITEGIFSFLLYLTLIIIIIYKNTKNRKNNKYVSEAYICFISYLIQAFFNISIIQTAPLLYIVMGLSNNDKI